MSHLFEWERNVNISVAVCFVLFHVQVEHSFKTEENFVAKKKNQKSFHFSIQVSRNVKLLRPLLKNDRCQSA